MFETNGHWLNEAIADLVSAGSLYSWVFIQLGHADGSTPKITFILSNTNHKLYILIYRCQFIGSLSHIERFHLTKTVISAMKCLV